jgi:tol-pal system protein YbgF
MELFKSGDYKARRRRPAGLRAPVPGSAYAANAQYWLGNAYYAQRDYKNAIAAQEVVVTTTYGTSAKAPDAMLNIASNYAELKDKKAKKTLQDLVKKYPDSAGRAVRQGPPGR